MVRKLLALIGAAALVAVLAPLPAHAQNGGVVIFSGDAVVGSNAYTGAQGDGLCFPGFTPNGATCEEPSGVPSLGGITNGWRFDVPATTGPVVGCWANGAFDGDPVTSVPVVDDPGNCTINSDGDVFQNAAGVGASCGMSSGTSTAGTADTFTVDNVGTADIDTQWITSAGGTLPINGQFDFGNGPADYVGLVQARPLPSAPGQIPCLTEPATTFFVLGVVAGAGA